jgi:putative hydrolase of the HAD superfamily
MQLKALILDLDNTIYPVKAIGEELFRSLFDRIEVSGEFKGRFSEIKAMLMKQPFQKVAEDFSFSEQLKKDCLQILPGLSYDKEMEPFEDYNIVRTLPYKKFLVTTGFPKMQYSKVKQLNLEKDFEKIYVVDPSQSDLTKRHIFEKILKEYKYDPEEVLVIGDDLESEIKFAQELGIPTLLYNHNGEQGNIQAERMITSFGELKLYV